MKKHFFFLALFTLFLLNGIMVKSNANETTSPSPDLLYMDISSSMKGYLGAIEDDRFVSTMAALIYSLNTEVRLFGSNESSCLSAEQFENYINLKKIPWSSESDLTGMISSAIERLVTENSNCAILVTDGIMSGSNEDIKRDPSYNKTRRGVLTQKVINVLNKYKNAGNPDLSAILIQYSSDFTGTYFDYKNSKISLKGVTRPYYVIFFVRTERLDYYYQLINSNERLSQLDNVYIVGDDSPKIRLIPYKQTASFVNGSLRLNMPEIKKNANKLLLTINIALLPDYMKDTTYINSNFGLFRDSGSGFRPIDKTRYSIAVNSNRIIISVEPSYVKSSHIRAVLKNALPVWIENYTSEDDSDLLSDENESKRTFNLKYLVEGFKPLAKYSEVSSDSVEII